MKGQGLLLIFLFTLYTITTQASPVKEELKEKRRTFSDLLHFPTSHNPWRKVLIENSNKDTDKNEMDKKTRLFSELLHFPRGHNPWKNVLEDRQRLP